MWTYRLRYVRCGKPSCHCRLQPSHGPYWYGYEHRGGKVYSKYFGKRPTTTFFTYTTAKAPPVDPRWRLDGKMTLRTALRIFGLDKTPNRVTLLARLRVLMLEHHPDRGGDPKIAAAIGAAYNYLKL